MMGRSINKGQTNKGCESTVDNALVMNTLNIGYCCCFNDDCEMKDQKYNIYYASEIHKKY